METNPNNNPAPQAPQIPESEMKLPDEQFGPQTVKSPAPTRAFSPVLIGLLVVLLIVLAAVIFWGEAIIGMFVPEEKVELPPLPEQPAPASTEAEIIQMESELNEAEFSEFEAEMQAIEAEMEAELQAE